MAFRAATTAASGSSWCAAAADAFIPAPATAPGCNGQAGSAVTQANLAQYLIPGPAGFINVDYDAFFAATNYHELSENAPVGTGAATGAANGTIEEKTLGYYMELNGESEFFGKRVRYNLGGRFVDTDQFVAGPVTLNNGTSVSIVEASHRHDVFAVPAVVQCRIERDGGHRAALRRFARPSLAPTRATCCRTRTFSDPSAQAVTLGNPDLEPFLSTNIDLGGEWYTGDEGYVGLTLFQKKITGFTVGAGHRRCHSAASRRSESLSTR